MASFCYGWNRIEFYVFFFSFFSALYSDQTDASCYPESDYSFTTNSSMISDFGEVQLSSTRRSSFFNTSIINGRPSYRGLSYNRLLDMDSKRQHWSDSTSRWASEGASMLSSTRVSAALPVAAIPVLEEHDLCTYDDGLAAVTDGKTSPSRRDTLPAFPSRRSNHKSVSFRDVDEYFPVFSPDSPKAQPAVHDSDLPFNLSEYPGFLHSDRMAAISQKQGIDVTSPDHVFAFCRESSESTEEDMEKTVLSHCAFEESDDEKEDVQVKEAKVSNPEQPACSRVGSSSNSSGTGSSKYSSCDSDHYTSALDASIHPRHLSLPAVDKVRVGADKNVSLDIDFKLEENVPPVQPEPPVGSKPEMLERSQLDKMSSELNDQASEDVDACSGSALDVCESGVDQLADKVTEAPEDRFDFTFTPSPFVTGRTQSRLSRCSLRTSRTPESLHLTSSLFEETLPTPMRARRQTPRSQTNQDFYSSPRTPSYTSSYPGSCTGGEPLPANSQDTQSSTVKAGSTVSGSQADTLILSKSVTESLMESQTLCDTVLVENKQDSSVDAYERNLAVVIKAMQGHALVEDFLTDDLTSSVEAAPKRNIIDGSSIDKLDSSAKEDAWISEDFSSQPDSVSSSSISSCLSSRGSSEDSDIPCTPGTGCTPRYSMSRLSSRRRPQHLANLSYTPGGRPLILDVDEPVQYLYTDTEQGHKLIETHVPPTANTSLSSSMISASSDETVIYDWRSMQTGEMGNRGKENQKPPQKERADEDLFPESKGMTDKELRLRLVELGESPGPISSRTRPTYMRRLCRLLQESKSQALHHQKGSDQSQTRKAL